MPPIFREHIMASSFRIPIRDPLGDKFSPHSYDSGPTLLGFLHMPVQTGCLQNDCSRLFSLFFWRPTQTQSAALLYSMTTHYIHSILDITIVIFAIFVHGARENEIGKIDETSNLYNGSNMRRQCSDPCPSQKNLHHFTRFRFSFADNNPSNSVFVSLTLRNHVQIVVFVVFFFHFV